MQLTSLLDEAVDEGQDPRTLWSQTPSHRPQEVPIPHPLVLERKSRGATEEVALKRVRDVVGVAAILDETSGNACANGVTASSAPEVEVAAQVRAEKGVLLPCVFRRQAGRDRRDLV